MMGFFFWKCLTSGVTTRRLWVWWLGLRQGLPRVLGHTHTAVGFSLALVWPLGLCPGCSCFKLSVQMAM